MDWAQILVIILSVFLALFLLMGIVLIAMLIRLTKQIKTVTSSAGRTAHAIERLVAGAASMVNPMMLLGVFKKVFKRKRE